MLGLEEALVLVPREGQRVGVGFMIGLGLLPTLEMGF